MLQGDSFFPYSNQDNPAVLPHFFRPPLDGQSTNAYGLLSEVCVPSQILGSELKSFPIAFSHRPEDDARLVAHLRRRLPEFPPVSSYSIPPRRKLLWIHLGLQDILAEFGVAN
jgi:hypothetical protein